MRDYSRVFFASASDEIPDKQGRITIPPALREYAALQRDCVVIGANTRLEIWDSAAWDSLPGPAGRRVLRRIRGGAARSSVNRRPRHGVPGEVSTRAGWPGRLTSLPRRQAAAAISASRGWGPGRATPQRAPSRFCRIPAAADGTREGGPMATTGPGHLPVMTDRVLALLAPALQPEGAVLLDATLGRAGHASALLSRHPGLTLIGIDADDAAIEESRQRARAVRAAGSRWSTPGTTRSPRSWPGSASRASRASCSTSGSPRRSSMTPAAASPTPTTRRWTCGWTRRGR